MVVIALPILIGGGLALAGLGAGIGGMLFGGQKQSQDLGQQTKAETDIKAPISQDVQPRYDQRDYSRIEHNVISNITDSPYAYMGTDANLKVDKPMTQTPILEIRQTPSQVITPETIVSPTQSAEQTATQDPTGGLLMIGAVAVGGFLVYKQLTKKKK